MHRIYLPTRKDTRYLYSSIANLYFSEYVDKVKTQHALSGTCARFIQETHTHTHIRWCYTFTWKLPHLAELEVFRLERLRDELVLLGPELRGCRRGRHGRQAVQHLTNIKLLHFPPGARDGRGQEHRVEISRGWWGGKPLSLVSAARLFKLHILKVLFTVSSMAKSLGCGVSVYSDSASRCVSNSLYPLYLSLSLSLSRSLLLST